MTHESEECGCGDGNYELFVAAGLITILLGAAMVISFAYWIWTVLK